VAASSVRAFEPGDEPALLTLAAAAVDVDRLPGIDRQDLAGDIDGFAADRGGVLVAVEDGRVVGYCAPRFDMLIVHPAFRRRGHGTRLIGAALEIARSRGHDSLVLYGSPGTAAGAGFIAATGATYVHSLWRLDLPPDVALSPPSFPASVDVRPYRHPDDLEAFTALADESFRDHPTPLPFTIEIIDHAHSQPGFDPASIVLVAPAADPSTMVAWARARATTTDAGEARGQIDFIGVLPAWRRRGLGRALLRWGIAKVRADGARVVQLTVTALNENALELYRSEGFVQAIEWPHDALSTSLG
jgi:mycothiol synthase